MKARQDAATNAKVKRDAATRNEDAATRGEGAAAEKKTSRRRFTKSVAAALAAAPVALSHAGAQQRPAEPKAPPNPQPTPTPAPQQQQQPPSPVAEAYAAVARARFGEHVTAEEFERVRRDLAGNVRAADALRAAKLKNSDEPDFIFEA
jgi:hypothetical protein